LTIVDFATTEAKIVDSCTPSTLQALELIIIIMVLTIILIIMKIIILMAERVARA